MQLITLDDLTRFNLDTGHSCTNYGYLLDESSAKIFDTLPD